MIRLPNEIYEVHRILERYIVIHDAIFKFSWREIIPIPGLFKPIKFGQHVADLNSLISSLDKLSTCLLKVGVPEIFNQYILALLDTVRFLRDMCKRLYDKSQGDQSYTKDQYKSDMAIYERFVNKYRSLGSAMNQYIC